MKKLSRFASVLLAMTMILSLSAFSASAVEESVPQSNAMVAAALSAEDCEIQYTKDGSARIITATMPAEQVVALTRAANPLHEEGTATWDYPSEVSFQCRNGWGKNCRVAVENVATNTCSMKVVFYHDINGDSVTTERTVKVGDVGVTFVESTTGADLTCRIDTTISPYRGVTVDWKYDCDQH